jgi:hypothetical protein
LTNSQGSMYHSDILVVTSATAITYKGDTRMNIQLQQILKLHALVGQADKEVAIIAALLGVKNDDEGFLPLLVKIREHLSKEKTA